MGKLQSTRCKRKLEKLLAHVIKGRISANSNLQCTSDRLPSSPRRATSELIVSNYHIHLKRL